MSCMAGPSGGEEKPGFMVSSSSGLAGYCYNTDHVSSSSGNQSVHHLHHHHQSITHLMGQLQQSSFEPNPEIYSTMEMVGFSSPAWNHQQNQNSTSTAIFPGEIRPNIIQGLSLSLNSSSNSFQLRQNEHNGLISFGPSPSSSRPVNNILQIRDSRYLGPAQELLNQFCNIGININDDDDDEDGEEVIPKLVKAQKTNSQRQDDHIKMQSLYSLDLLELHNRKSKLLLMLQEVDKRYKHYCRQMKAVVSSFEAVAGNGAATVYSALASRAMSRHFRSLKDGIVNEINATKKAMDEKDSTTSTAPGTTKGETPRLRLLDQTLRQQKAFQQMGMTECHPWRPQRGLPERSVSVLRAWLFEHFLHPYPSDVDKHILARQTGLSRSQVSNWFINARVRLWKPMVEEMYVEELKEQQEGALDRDAANPDENSEMVNGQDFSRNDQKPSHDQLFRIDSECLSSIININSSDKCDGINRKGKGLIGDSSSYSAMELDFSSYGQHHSAVSLTLGLHQHGGSSGVNLAYPHGQSTHSSSNFYPRDDHHNGMEDWQTVHREYSNLLDSESQTVPYRNLMDSQLLHDFNG